MPGLGTITIIGIAVAAILVFVFLKMRQKDRLGAIMQKRKPSSRLVTQADYIEGAQTIPVVLSLGTETIYYENPDLEASFDLDRIDEVEYDDDLATGKRIYGTQRVLRLRSHGAAFEFLIEKKDAGKWESALPQRRLGGSATVTAG